MKIPNKLKISGHTLDVKITNDNNCIDTNEIGKTIIANNIIYINKNYPKSQQEETLIHELLHNCFYCLGEEQSEPLIQRLGAMLYSIIIDNPNIFK